MRLDNVCDKIVQGEDAEFSDQLGLEAGQISVLAKLERAKAILKEGRVGAPPSALNRFNAEVSFCLSEITSLKLKAAREEYHKDLEGINANNNKLLRDLYLMQITPIE